MNRIRLILIILIFSLTSSCKDHSSNISQESDLLTFTVNHIEDRSKVYLVDYELVWALHSNAILDSTIINNKKFSFKNTYDEPRYTIIVFQGIDQQLHLPINPGPLEAQINYNRTSKNLSVAYHGNDKTLIDYLKYKKIKNFPNDYISKNPDNFNSLYILKGKLKELKKDSIKLLYETLSTRLKETDQGRVIRSAMNSESSNSIGSKFYDFSLKDSNEKLTRLSDINKKLTLIDFTASWCKPCKASIPFQKELYKKYHDKGLEIIHIYLEGKDRMKTVVNEEKIEWHTLYEPNGFESTLANLYSIEEIPRLFILDSKSEIIADDDSEFMQYTGDSELNELYQRIDIFLNEQLTKQLPTADHRK